MLRFVDSSESVMACVGEVPFGRDLVPFLVPEQKNAPLCIVPVNVNMALKEKFTFSERHRDMIPLYGMALLLLLLGILGLLMMAKIP